MPAFGESCRPDRSAPAFTTGAPRRLTYAHADRAVSAIAARLRREGLACDEVVALQMPNTVEAVLALLGVLRADLIASPLPLLWRHAYCTANTRALITHEACRHDRPRSPQPARRPRPSL